MFDDKHLWSICRPCLVFFKDTCKAVLCGYRTNNFLKELCDYCNNNGLKVDIQYNHKAPDAIFIDFLEYSKLEDFKKCNPFDISISENFSNKILYLFPDIKKYLSRLIPINDSLIKDYETEHYEYFCTNQYRFEKIQEGFRVGLYRLKHRYNKKYYIYDGNKWFESEPEIGKYTALYLQNTNALKIKDNKLFIPLGLGLPELLDRAVTMLIGLNPEIINGNYVYNFTDSNIIQKIACKLGQKLEV